MVAWRLLRLRRSSRRVARSGTRKMEASRNRPATASARTQLSTVGDRVAAHAGSRRVGRVPQAVLAQCPRDWRRERPTNAGRSSRQPADRSYALKSGSGSSSNSLTRATSHSTRSLPQNRSPLITQVGTPGHPALSKASRDAANIRRGPSPPSAANNLSASRPAAETARRTTTSSLTSCRSTQTPGKSHGTGHARARCQSLRSTHARVAPRGRSGRLASASRAVRKHPGSAS